MRSLKLVYVGTNDGINRYSGLTLSQAYKSNETEKKRSYNDRILQIENATFTPLVFSCTGGMAPECRVFFKQLASLLSDKWKETYSVIASWVKTKLSFALLRSALLCIRGTRHPFHKPIVADTTDIEFEAHCTNINEAKQNKMFVCENPGGQKNVHQAGRESIFFLNFQTIHTSRGKWLVLPHRSLHLGSLHPEGHVWASTEAERVLWGNDTQTSLWRCLWVDRS